MYKINFIGDWKKLACRSITLQSVKTPNLFLGLVLFHCIRDAPNSDRNNHYYSFVKI